MAQLRGSKTEKNLQEAFAGESQARNKYTAFASVACKEGYTLLENLETGAAFARPAKTRWRCRECGFTHEGTQALKMCPVCKHPQAFQEVAADNF